jgi:hypothetical protein
VEVRGEKEGVIGRGEDLAEVLGVDSGDLGWDRSDSLEYVC